MALQCLIDTSIMISCLFKLASYQPKNVIPDRIADYSCDYHPIFCNNICSSKCCSSPINVKAMSDPFNTLGWITEVCQLLYHDLPAKAVVFAIHRWARSQIVRHVLIIAFIAFIGRWYWIKCSPQWVLSRRKTFATFVYVPVGGWVIPC